jgi:hypothetical protein
LNSHLDDFLNIVVQWVRSKKKITIKTLSKWKEDTRAGGMLTRWVTTAGCYIEQFRKTHIRGRATLAASLARENDSTRPLNKI